MLIFLFPFTNLNRFVRILGGSCNNEWIVEEETDERIDDNDDNDDDDMTSCIQTNDENGSTRYINT